MYGVSPIPNHILPTDQIDGNRLTGERQLLQFPVVQVFAQHRIELPATVLVKEVPVLSARQSAEDPREMQIVSEVAGAGSTIKPGGLDCPGHRPSACAGNRIHDDTILLQSLAHTPLGHSPCGPTAESHADADTTQGMHQTFQATREH